MIYKRRYRILLDGEPFITSGDGRQLRITFSVSTGFTGMAGTGDLAMYNLTTDSMNAVKVGSIITLQCGYESDDIAGDSDDIGTIYTGKINYVLRERDGTDLLVRVLMRSEISNHKEIDHVFPVNTSVADVLRFCAKAAGYPIVMKSASFEKSPILTSGLTKKGDPVNIITSMQDQYNFQSVVENGQIIIYKSMGDRGDGVTKIDQFSGMEMMPEVSGRGIDVVVRLNSKLAVGRLFRVESKYATYTLANFHHDHSKEDRGGEEAGGSIHYIFKLEHKGDSHGAAWSTHITGLLKTEQQGAGQ